MRVECLNLIGQLSHVTSDSEIPLVTLEEYCSDSDPRVRAAALHGLVSYMYSDLCGVCSPLKKISYLC